MFFYLMCEREVMQKPKVCRNIDIRQCFNESCDKKYTRFESIYLLNKFIHGS